MSHWQFIQPASATNLITNPSFETNTTGWTTGSCGACAIAQSSLYQKWGLYSLETTWNGAGLSVPEYAITLPTATSTYLVSAWIYFPSNWDGGNVTCSHRLFVGSATTTAVAADATMLDVWQHSYSIFTVAADVIGQVSFTLSGPPTGGRTYHVDGVQCIETSNLMTYIDGDQPGCYWTTTAHASTSVRSAESRAGGIVRDFKDDYGFGQAEWIGTGMPPTTVSIDPYALLPGGELNNIKTQSRPFSLIGTLKGSDCDCDINVARRELIEELAHDTYPKDYDGWQPVRLRYDTVNVDKNCVTETRQIEAHYEQGLEANIQLENRIHEKLSLRFLAPDPYWYELGNSACVLDPNDSDTFRIVGARLTSTGQWDSMGPPNVLGTYTDIRAIAIDTADKRVYFGGDFLNFNNDADADRIVVWDPIASSWSWPLNEGVDNNYVSSLVFGTDGTLYVGGSFTSVSGAMANTNRIASWDTSTETWTALGNSSDDAEVESLAIDHNGDLVAGGTFTGMGGVANTNRIAVWNGAAWLPLSNGIDNGTVYALAVGTNGDVYAGGSFTTVDGGSAYVRIAGWDGSAWYDMGDANNTVYSLDVDPDTGALYACGAFTTIGGVTVNGAAKWNGTSWIDIGSGLPTGISPRVIRVAPDGLVYIGTLLIDAARKGSGKGGDWASLDIGVTFNALVRAFAFGDSDPVIRSNYDVYIGHDKSATFEYAGTAAVMNDGTAPAFPKFVVERSGGASALLIQLRNETTGKELLSEYALADGEILTVDLSPTEKSVTSNFYGKRFDAILSSSAVGEWSLQPGDNQVACFVEIGGGATVTAYLQWKDTYKSFD